MADKNATDKEIITDITMYMFWTKEIPNKYINIITTLRSERPIDKKLRYLIAFMSKKKY
jgi:hypothetical protein